jgi:integrase
MPRARTGSFWWTGKKRTGDLYGRVTWTDEHGKNHDRKRKAVTGTKREARQHIKDLLAEIEEQGEQGIEGSTLTIKQLADYYKKHFAVPAEYDKQGIKKSGMRSHKDARRKTDFLVSHFGPATKVKNVTYGDLALFKATRLRTPVTIDHVQHKKIDGKRVKIVTREESPRAVASVHRELATLRRMFRIAIQHRWLRHNPFNEGEPLIKPAEEHEREIIATKAQENALLAACDEDKRRKPLKAFLVLAFDTGFRPIEMTSLTVKDVDFEDNCIWAVSYKGKMMKRRPFEMTARLRAAMFELCVEKKPGEPVFGFKSVKRSFATAKRIAKAEGISLDGFRLYDARHTATTRLVRRGMSLEESGKLMGHSQPKTTWRYMHVDKSRRRRAAELLEQDDE